MGRATQGQRVVVPSRQEAAQIVNASFRLQEIVGTGSRVSAGVRASAPPDLVRFAASDIPARHQQRLQCQQSCRQQRQIDCDGPENVRPDETRDAREQQGQSNGPGVADPRRDETCDVRVEDGHGSARESSGEHDGNQE